MKAALCLLLCLALPVYAQAPAADAPVASECDAPDSPADVAETSYCLRSAGEPAPIPGRLLSFSEHRDREQVNARNARLYDDIVTGGVTVVAKAALYSLVAGASGVTVALISLLVGLAAAHKL